MQKGLETSERSELYTCDFLIPGVVAFDLTYPDQVFFS